MASQAAALTQYAPLGFFLAILLATFRATSVQILPGSPSFSCNQSFLLPLVAFLEEGGYKAKGISDKRYHQAPVVFPTCGRQGLPLNAP